MKIELLLFLLIPSTAYCYFDIGTGSYLFQIAIASFLGVMYTTRSYLTAIYRKIFGKTVQAKEAKNPNATHEE